MEIQAGLIIEVVGETAVAPYTSNSRISTLVPSHTAVPFKVPDTIAAEVVGFTLIIPVNVLVAAQLGPEACN